MKNSFKEISKEELLNKRTEFETELRNLNFKLKEGKLGNPVRIRIVKRLIARINTNLREWELGIRKEVKATVA